MKKYGLMIIAFFLCFLILLRVGKSISVNVRIQGAFQESQVGSAQFRQQIPIEEIDFGIIDRLYVSHNSTLMDGMLLFSPLHILDRDIVYYVEEDGKKVESHRIPKGSSILWFPGGYGGGYGLRSYPTYEKGWRYVHPFLVVEEVEAQWCSQLEDMRFNQIYGETPCYYVRLSELENLAEQIFTENETGIRESILFSQDGDLSVKKLAQQFIFYYDDAFYRKGVYLSPDLFKTYWDSWDWVLAALAILFWVLFWIEKNRRAEK